MTEEGAVAEGNAVKAVHLSTASPTALQPTATTVATTAATATTANQRFHRARADGTSCLEIKAGSVLQTAQNSNHSVHLNSRETAKGADEREFGDPLLNIHQQQKQSSLHPRCNH